jgi:hypothetical protein
MPVRLGGRLTTVGVQRLAVNEMQMAMCSSPRICTTRPRGEGDEVETPEPEALETNALPAGITRVWAPGSGASLIGASPS